MGDLNKLIGVLNPKLKIEFYQFVFGVYPEIEISELITFMQNVKAKISKNLDCSTSMRDYSSSVIKDMSYVNKDEGYWIIACLCFSELLLLVRDDELTERALIILLEFNYQYPNLSDPMFELINLLKRVPSQIVKNLLSNFTNVKKLIKFYSVYSAEWLPKIPIIKFYKRQVFEILPVSIIHNEDFWKSLIGEVPTLWFPRHFKYLVHEYNFEQRLYRRHPDNEKRLSSLSNYIENTKMSKLRMTCPVDEKRVWQYYGQIQGLSWARYGYFDEVDDENFINSSLIPLEKVDIGAGKIIITDALTAVNIKAMLLAENGKTKLGE